MFGDFDLKSTMKLTIGSWWVTIRGRTFTFAACPWCSCNNSAITDALWACCMLRTPHSSVWIIDTTDVECQYNPLRTGERKKPLIKDVWSIVTERRMTDERRAKLREKAEASKNKKREEKRRVADEGRWNKVRSASQVCIYYLTCLQRCTWTLFYNALRQRLPYIAPGYQRSRCASVNWIPNLPLRSEASPHGDGFWRAQ